MRHPEPLTPEQLAGFTESEAAHERAQRFLAGPIGMPLSAGDAAVDALVETYVDHDGNPR